MKIYIIVFTSLILYSLIGINRPIRKNVYIVPVILLALFAGLRGNGYDYGSYLRIFDAVKLGFTFSGVNFIEPGFQFLMLISPTFKFSLFLTAVISILLTLLATYRFSKSYLPLLGLVIFYTTLMMPTYMGQIRQGLAIGITSWAIFYNYKGDKKKTIILILIAMLFHITSLLVAVILFIRPQKYSFKVYLFLILGAFASKILITPIFSILLNISHLSIMEKVLFYSADEESGLGFTSTILIRVATLFLALWLNKKNIPSISYICNIYLCGIMIYLALDFIPNLALRGIYYFSVFEIAIVPFIVYQLRRNTALYLAGYISVIALSAYRLYSYFSTDIFLEAYVPYLLY